MRNFWLVAPYAAWMVLMAALPATASAYAIRTGVVAAILLVVLRSECRKLLLGDPSRNTAVSPRSDFRSFLPSLAVGFATGIMIFVVWILPEQAGWEWYRRWCIVGEGGTQAVAEASAVMIAIRLIGSAFVISVAEELFFRKWLSGFAGFWWMVGLFAIEHDRWLVAAICGIAYGWLYLRRGLVAAIAAHMTTNLLLGLWVLKTGQWQFW